MVDEQHPTAQFHPYHAPTATPHAERAVAPLRRMLHSFGIQPSTVDLVTEIADAVDVRASRLGAWAHTHRVVLIGAAAAAFLALRLSRGWRPAPARAEARG
ncbi:MAG TPA: hypothetical protein VMT00_08580 [Thermoanaerobaculia bacterium]|nr:hypothetical protein [Thermoanaerobaculia bacterium]